MSDLNINQLNLPHCPITGQHMKDPVTTPDGNTYERQAIEHWLSNHTTEPQTRNYLTVHQLVPNRVLREMYESVYGSNQNNANIINQNIRNEVVLQQLGLELSSNQVSETDYKVLVTIKSPVESEEDYHDIVLTMDVSGSMDSSIDITGSERTGLSIRDLLVHSAKVIVKLCNEKHRIGIVKFSSEGTVVKPLTVVDAAGKRELELALDTLTPGGNTNLFDGITKSWSLFEDSPYKKSIILFTDGEPNVEPPRGYVNQLKHIKETKYNGKYISDISIYTYGTNVNSTLSDQISKETNGVYGFIPDSRLMGDLLTHKLAVLRTTKTKNATISIELGDNVENYNISDSISYNKITNNMFTINVGDVLFETDRHFIIDVKTNGTAPTMYASLDYNGIKVEQTEVINSNANILYNQLRQDAVNIITRIITSTDNNNIMESERLTNNFLSLLNDSDLRIVDLNDTFSTQVKLSYTNAYYKKWGRHYLISLRRALQLEQCNNYKDTCIQHFAGAKFNSILDEADDIFNSLPPPTPSRRYTSYSGYSGYGSYSSGPSAPINMSTFSGRDNGCFHGLSKVSMYNGDIKNANEIIKGDEVKLANGMCGIIECVVKTIIERPINMVRLNSDLHITKYHPVKYNNIWSFPCDLQFASPSTVHCNAVYSFVLTLDQNNNQKRSYDSGMIIGGLECITLGHGITNDLVATHPFYGTEVVINNLKESSDYNNGLVTLQQDSVVRSPVTNLAERIII